MKKLVSLLPKFLKPVLKLLYSAVLPVSTRKALERKLFYNKTPRATILSYWADPKDAGNSPEAYMGRFPMSQFLFDIVHCYAPVEAKTLEIGCNVGRNLNYLFQSGYKNLEAIEISDKAVALLKQAYPEMALHTKIYNASIEETIRKLGDRYYDMVFTTAVLEHIHYDSEWIFPEIARITKGYLITIEDEYATTDWRHFPRNYKRVFEALGMRQVKEIECSEVAYLPSNNKGFSARVFRRW